MLKAHVIRRKGDRMILDRLGSLQATARTVGFLFVLSSIPTTPIVDGNDRLDFGFEGTLPESIDPGILLQLGWKACASGATIEPCSTCYNNCGLVPVLRITGGAEDVVFIYDPADTESIYIRVDLGRSECGADDN